MSKPVWDSGSTVRASLAGTCRRLERAWERQLKETWLKQAVHAPHSEAS